MEILSLIYEAVANLVTGPAAFEVLGVGIAWALILVVGGFMTGIFVGATPGLAGPMAMAMALPILVSVFKPQEAYLLPALAFLIGIMKGATVGGAVPAILFNTPGTPDALMTTLDGYPMAQKGQAGKALRVAHFSSAAGDTFSDLVLILAAPFLAIWIEQWLDLPEKAALILLSLSFIAVLVGKSVWKGLLAGLFGMFVTLIGTGEDPAIHRMTFDIPALSDGLPVAVVILGVLILGEVLVSIETEITQGVQGNGRTKTADQTGDQRLTWPLIKRLLPTMSLSALIGTGIGALPGVGSTLAATLGHTVARGRKRRDDEVPLGQGNPMGIAATEAANSSVSGANLIPVLSLGIPGNAAAVFLILAFESFGGLNPGPGIFAAARDGLGNVDPSSLGPLKIVIGVFVLMMLANLCNWTFGGAFMRFIGILSRVPKHILLPLVLVITLTSIYIERPDLIWLIIALIFGFVGYAMRKVGMPVLPFVIAFILTRGDNGLEAKMREALGSTKSVFFLFETWTSSIFTVLALALPLLILLLRTRSASQHD